MTDNRRTPDIPRLTSKGHYDPEDLKKYMGWAKRHFVSDMHIARTLRVPLHRVAYMRNGGLEIMTTPREERMKEYAKRGKRQ